MPSVTGSIVTSGTGAMDSAFPVQERIDSTRCGADGWGSVAVDGCPDRATLALPRIAWHRPPPRKGSPRARAAREPDRMTVYRDALGVPHVRAADHLALAYEQGLVTARDRGWQIEVDRWRAEGRLAERVGADGVEWDRFARRARLADTAQRAYAALADEDRAFVDAYVAGVNARARSTRRRARRARRAVRVASRRTSRGRRGRRSGSCSSTTRCSRCSRGCCGTSTCG